MATRRRHRGKREAGGLRASFAKLSWKRLVGVVAASLAAAWLTIAVGFAGTTRGVRPDLALSVMPFDARAKVKSAEMQLARSRASPAAIARARTLALAALRRDPTLVQAWRLLALAASADGRDPEAARLFHFAERLSRRDLPTQLWLIEENVSRNDIRGALRHYDIALRTSLASPEILFPVLVRASGDSGVVGPLGDLLAADPPWRETFMWQLVADAPNDAHVVRLFERIARRDEPLDPDLSRALLQRLVNREKYPEALRAFALVSGQRVSGAGVRNGDFERTNETPPFDWLLEDGATLRAEQVRSGDRRGNILNLYAANGNGGAGARQLLMLPPGQYVLSALAGAVESASPARLSWTVICAREGGAALLNAHAEPVEPRARQLRLAFRVPAGCPAQWLSLNITADFQTESASAWVDSVRIARGSGG